MRSRKGLPVWLSTVRYCLSSRTVPVPVASLCSWTGRAGKFHDAPLLRVERNTYSALDWSTLFDTPRPRLNSWQEKYTFPLVSQSTDVSPPACQYWRGGGGGGVAGPREAPPPGEAAGLVGAFPGGAPSL